MIRSPPSTPTSAGFDGSVGFAFDVSHASFGKVHINSKFKRLKPNFERVPVDMEHIQRLKSKLMNWVRSFIDITGKETYFEELTTATIRFSVYVNPFSELDGKPMEIVIQIFFWLWFTDDELEDAIERGIPFESLKKGTDQLKDIWKGKYDGEDKVQFQDVSDYPFFRPLFYSLLDLHRICQRDIPDYQERIGPSQFLLHRYFEAQRWFSVDVLDSRYSEVSFANWRRIIAYFDGIAEAIALVEGVNLPRYIRTSPTFQRMLEIVNSVGGCVNDLLGMNKEFGNDQKDNFVVFKNQQKKMPLDVAVQEICDLLDMELKDFLLLKKVVLKEFSQEPSLVKYIDILESLIDGHNRIYPESTRHRSAGCIRLCRRCMSISIL